MTTGCRKAPIRISKQTMTPTAILPSFPDDIPTHPLLIIDFKLIQERHPQEIDRLWEAATQIGFW